MAEKKVSKKAKVVKDKKVNLKSHKVKSKKKEILKKIKKVQRRKISSKVAHPERKAKLAVKGRQTKWAPVWAVLKKFGTGKRIHPSSMTKHRRSWRRTKLHIKPRKQRKSHFG